MRATIIAVRLKDWIATGKKLPPWLTGKDVCAFCGETVIITPDYGAVVESLGFEIQYICTHCFSKHPVAS